MHRFQWSYDGTQSNPMQVKIGEYIVSNLDVKKSVKTLGVHVNPSAKWKDELQQKFTKRRKIDKYFCDILQNI